MNRVHETIIHVKGKPFKVTISQARFRNSNKRKVWNQNIKTVSSPNPKKFQALNSRERKRDKFDMKKVQT